MSPAAFHIAILRSAAMLVPQWQRPDWLAEWQSELWHIRRDPHGINVAAFCLGAFRDAFCLRRDSVTPGSQSVLHLDVPPTPAGIDSFPDEGEAALSSPVRCLSYLAALSALFLTIALLLPASRSVLLGTLYPRNVIMLNGDEFGADPPVSRDQFESLKVQYGTQFTSLSFHGGTVVGRLRYETLRDSRLHFIRLRERSFGLLFGAVPTFAMVWILAPLMLSGSTRSRLQRTGTRRGLFLAAKTLLVFLIIMFGSLDAASAGSTVSPIYFDIILFASYFAVRWIFEDQRQRCPVCLRLLTNPVRIGGASRILLEWHGTELMCTRGHGMLYVPEWPAIWSGRQ